MKTTSNKEINYSLHNSENYKKELDSDISDITDKISGLFIGYFKFILENISFKKTDFTRFIIIRGLDTIKNVFNHLLFYTKNIELTYFHCQKAFYYYIEFVGQISEDEKVFLQLTSRDATTYVYKKTIFDISNELRKNNENISDYTKLKINIINSYTELYRTLILKLINCNYTDNNNLIHLEELYKKLNSLNNKTVIEELNKVVNKLFYSMKNVAIFYDITNQLIKKIYKNPNALHNIENKLLSDDFNSILNDNHDKFVSWIIN